MKRAILMGLLFGILIALVVASLSAYLLPDGWPRP